MTQSITATPVGSIKVGQSTVFLKKYYWLANAIDSKKTQFRGWIHIRGLPFNSWNTKIFESIANLWGGLLEVDRNTESLSILTEATIKVNSNDLFTIPHSINITLNSINIPIQLTPLFTVEDEPTMVKIKKTTAERSTSNLLVQNQASQSRSNKKYLRPKAAPKHQLRIPKMVNLTRKPTPSAFNHSKPSYLRKPKQRLTKLRKPPSTNESLFSSPQGIHELSHVSATQSDCQETNNSKQQHLSPISLPPPPKRHKQRETSTTTSWT